jgi:hypothetical protein
MSKEDIRTGEAWTCKVGRTGDITLPGGADNPMRLAVQEAFKQVTGFYPEFCFSGWGSKLTPMEAAIVANDTAEQVRVACKEAVLDGAALIAQERERQVNVEGRTLAMDRLYVNDELPKAAACYLTPHWVRKKMAEDGKSVDPLWPFPAETWKPGDGTTAGRVRELVKAGALIAAEIDRLLGEAE